MGAVEGRAHVPDTLWGHAAGNRRSSDLRDLFYCCSWSSKPRSQRSCSKYVMQIASPSNQGRNSCRVPGDNGSVNTTGRAYCTKAATPLLLNCPLFTEEHIFQLFQCKQPIHYTSVQVILKVFQWIVSK